MFEASTNGCEDYGMVECDDGSIACCEPNSGCVDASGIFPVDCPEPTTLGCTDSNANNYDEGANAGQTSQYCHYETDFVIGDSDENQANNVTQYTFDDIFANCASTQQIEIYIFDSDILNQDDLNNHITLIQAINVPTGVEVNLSTDPVYGQFLENQYGTITINVGKITFDVSINQPYESVEFDIEITDEFHGETLPNGTIYNGKYTIPIIINTLGSYDEPFFAESYYRGDGGTYDDTIPAFDGSGVDYGPVGSFYPPNDESQFNLIGLDNDNRRDFTINEGEEKEFTVTVLAPNLNLNQFEDYFDILEPAYLHLQHTELIFENIY